MGKYLDVAGRLLADRRTAGLISQRFFYFLLLSGGDVGGFAMTIHAVGNVYETGACDGAGMTWGVIYLKEEGVKDRGGTRGEGVLPRIKILVR